MEVEWYLSTYTLDTSTYWLTTLGINKVSANLQDQLIAIEGTAAPSSIVAAIQDTGRDAILRGTGKSNSQPNSLP